LLSLLGYYLTLYKGIRKKAAKKKNLALFLVLVLSLLPLAFGQAPFPGISGVLSARSSALSASLTAYVISVENEPAFTTFARLMATATHLSTDEKIAFAAADNM
jgi:hypothetical protein